MKNLAWNMRGVAQRQKTFFVYIMTNVSGTLYTGVANNIGRRVYEHRTHLVRGFTTKYRINKLLYYEELDGPSAAIEREKQVKGWTRRKKITLIESMNPQWKDLAADWWKMDSMESEAAGEILHSADSVQNDGKCDP